MLCKDGVRVGRGGKEMALEFLEFIPGSIRVRMSIRGPNMAVSLLTSWAHLASLLKPNPNPNGQP